jgi:hypothetical protein
MSLRPVIVAAVGLALAGSALAQSRTAVDQLERGAAPALEAAQVGPQTSRAAPLPQVAAHGDGSPATAQVTRPAEARAQTPQLSSLGTGAAPTDQLAKGRTAEGPAALSSPAQGRDPRVEKLDGDDRCDPRNLTRLAPAERARCGQVIERRSAEFTRPAPIEPSPEERLLRFQEVGDGASARTAARALAHGDVEDSLAAQAIASSANRSGQEERTARSAPMEPELTPAAQAVIEAIVQGAAGVTVR